MRPRHHHRLCGDDRVGHRRVGPFERQHRPALLPRAHGLQQCVELLLGIVDDLGEMETEDVTRIPAENALHVLRTLNNFSRIIDAEHECSRRRIGGGRLTLWRHHGFHLSRS